MLQAGKYCGRVFEKRGQLQISNGLETPTTNSSLTRTIPKQRLLLNCGKAEIYGQFRVGPRCVISEQIQINHVGGA